jgi:hypothetical protein
LVRHSQERRLPQAKQRCTVSMNRSGGRQNRTSFKSTVRVTAQPIQSTAFNLSLDKYPRTRYSLVKVLLTVPPVRPSFLRPPAVHPANHRFFTPLFSTSSEPLFSQVLCFHIYLRCPIVFFQRQNSPTSVLSVRCFLSQLFCPQPLAASLFALCAFFRTRSLCFQSIAASFAKYPGVWVSRKLLRDTRGGDTPTATAGHPGAYMKCMDIRVPLRLYALCASVATPPRHATWTPPAHPTIIAVKRRFQVHG